MKTVKYALFAFQPMDCEAARLWLTELCEEGWELQKLPGFLFLPARFVPRTRDDLKYCVDLNTDPHIRDAYIAPDGYQQMVLDSGWVLVGNCQGVNVYKSAPGRNPAPIHTEPELARKRLWRLAVLPELIGCAILALLLPGLAFLASRLGTGPAVLLRLLETNWQLFQGLALALLALFYPCAALRSLVVWFRTGDPDPDVRRARRRGRLAAVAQVLWFYAVLVCALFRLFLPNGLPLSPSQLAAVPVLQAEDLPQAGHILSAHRTSSLFLETVHVAGGLDQTRYDCRWSWVADLAVEETRSSYRDYYGGLAPVELGFDGSWSAGQVLLLRQGNTVVFLYGDVDWTAPEYRPLLEALF